ncbi:hypothetical protein [Mesorhizobium sp.]|uniref:hypothetical protein n=1 Tax=Mesorhizobium sp. TaxID=1871066 RepID=UPI000FE76D3E|nr:hypothetical protein [Mesorhizobium sp.]RWN24372.1 MAG: hypothetical protein EOR95_33100 [Mesorhizobium sp.]
MVNTDPLLGPKLKIERAKRHVSDFETAMKAFFESGPYELVADIDPKTGEEVFRVRVHQCVPDEFSIITGDIVHNLRSALDQMICGLVRANRKQVSGGNGFPIMGSAKRLEEAAVGKLKNISVKADRFIRRLKPYKGGNNALWMLAELDNMDKHNAIVPVAAGRMQMQMQVGMPGMFLSPNGELCIGGGPSGSVPFGFQLGWTIPDDAKIIELVHDDCEIYRCHPDLAHFPRNMQASIDITFGKTDVTANEPIIETLKSLIKLIERIVDIVERRIL